MLDNSRLSADLQFAFGLLTLLGVTVLANWGGCGLQDACNVPDSSWMLGSAGSATIANGPTQAISLSIPCAEGARCTLTSSVIGSKVVRKPATITRDKSQENVNVVCKKRCFQDGVGAIPSHTEAMIEGNVLVGGVVGPGVDAISGAMNKYNDNKQFTTVRIGGCRA